MTLEEIITSGTLELYVMGSLTQREAMEVEDALEDHPELKKEIEAIEATLMGITESSSIEIRKEVWNQIQRSIQGTRKQPGTTRSIHWPALSGWAAAILFMGGIFWMMKENNTLENEVKYTTTQNVLLEEKVASTEAALASSSELLEIVRSNAYREISLPGNPSVSPESYAKVYYNDNEKIAYVDARGLPAPPKGKVYQVWSLLMDPLTPRSVGTLEGYQDSTTKVFKLENIPDPEAFGITLEPEGGSKSPTLTQLYTLGMASL